MGKRFEVPPGSADVRLDVFLTEALDVPRTRVRRLLARRLVSVDGRPVDDRAKGRRLAAGTRVVVAEHEAPDQESPLPESQGKLTVLAEGNGWVALDKPTGSPVHPYEADETGTVLNALVALRPEILGVGEGGLRCGVLHRLDLPTSGVLLFATLAPVWERLRGAFRDHGIEKCYRALVHGKLERDGSLELDLMTSRHRPARVRVRRPGERVRRGAVRRTGLRWKVLESFQAATLVEVRPVTGFQHQIRVSFQHLGHPVLGDSAYGAPESVDAPRLMLHASLLRFEEIEVRSPDPEDFSRMLAALRSGDS